MSAIPIVSCIVLMFKVEVSTHPQVDYQEGVAQSEN